MVAPELAVCWGGHSLCLLIVSPAFLVMAWGFLLARHPRLHCWGGEWALPLLQISEMNSATMLNVVSWPGRSVDGQRNDSAVDSGWVMTRHLKPEYEDSTPWGEVASARETLGPLPLSPPRGRIIYPSR